jgi:hypothetical protein
MADGVGVKGGGFGASLAVFLRLLLGVVGGGGMAARALSVSADTPSCAMAFTAIASVDLDLRPRFFGRVVVSAIWPLGSSLGWDGTRDERLRDIALDVGPRKLGLNVQMKGRTAIGTSERVTVARSSQSKYILRNHKSLHMDIDARKVEGREVEREREGVEDRPDVAPSFVMGSRLRRNCLLGANGGSANPRAARERDMSSPWV